MLAVAYGHIDAVSLLVEKEASVDAADTLGCTALHRGVTANFSTLDPVFLLYAFCICFVLMQI